MKVSKISKKKKYKTKKCVKKSKYTYNFEEKTNNKLEKLKFKKKKLQAFIYLHTFFFPNIYPNTNNKQLPYVFISCKHSTWTDKQKQVYREERK